MDSDSSDASPGPRQRGGERGTGKGGSGEGGHIEGMKEYFKKRKKERNYIYINIS